MWPYGITPINFLTEKWIYNDGNVNGDSQEHIMCFTMMSAITKSNCITSKCMHIVHLYSKSQFIEQFHEIMQKLLGCIYTHILADQPARSQVSNMIYITWNFTCISHRLNIRQDDSMWCTHKAQSQKSVWLCCVATLAVYDAETPGGYAA